MKKALLTTTWLLACSAALALELPPFLGSAMILQRDSVVPIWGRGRAGEAITVQFAGQEHKSTVAEDGSWRINLEPMPAASTGRDLVLRGDNEIRLSDVLVGDVWLCAGQSNMQWGLRSITGSGPIVAASANPRIRLLSIPTAWSREPQWSVKAQWRHCEPSSSGGFSAVGYLVGRDIEAAVAVPVGLINIAWGGCRVESMSSLESFRQFASLSEVAARVESEVAAMKRQADEELRKDKQRLSTALYNAMVHPLGPYAVKGMLWYQGEDNHYEGAIYGEKLKALAYSWRRCFEQENMPIYIVQIPPYKYGEEDPTRVPNFWRAQQRFAEEDRHAGFIVTTDCGLAEDIHPPEKRPLAKRLAQLVLYRTYGQGDDSSMSPTFRDCVFDGSRAVVDFHRPNGLKTRDGLPVSHVELAGADGVFHAAKAEIVDDRLVLSSHMVAAPQRVRFGWHKLANPNLVNRSGVPVAPFDSALP
jgi:sialate O-acetylesterase